MRLEFASEGELLGVIKEINICYYELLNANILYIEELSDRIFVVYIIELRDAYSHLVRIFDHDPCSVTGKQEIKDHLNKYISHLQRGLLDTFRKILALELKSLKQIIHRNNVRSVEHQVAQQAHRLRIMDDKNSIDSRIAGYKELMNYLSSIRKKLT